MSNPVTGSVSIVPIAWPDASAAEAVPNVNARVSEADGLLGSLGLFNVEIDGRTQVMSRQDLEALHAAAGAPASSAPARAARPAEHPVAKRMLDVVEQVYSHARFAHIDAAGSPLDRAIVNQFVRLGEVAKGGPCLVNADREELFMLGAHVVAGQLNLEQPFAEAAARGSKDRQAHDARQVHLWGDGSISTKGQRAEYLQRVEVQRMLQTLSNITGGVAGAIGYGIGGDRGSDIGAMVDGAVLALGDPLRARAMSQAPSPAQRTPLEPLARRASSPDRDHAHTLSPNGPLASGAPKTNGSGSAALTSAASNVPRPMLAEPIAGDTARGGINWNPLRAPSLERYMPNAGNVPIVGAIAKKGVTTVDFQQLQANHGGRIFAATDMISGSHVETLTHELLSGSLSRGKNIVILTGRHGGPDGFDVGQKKTDFLISDFTIAPAAKNVEILDATKLSPAQMRDVLQRGDDVILGWCHSENSRQVMNALGVNVRWAPF